MLNRFLIYLSLSDIYVALYTQFMGVSFLYYQLKKYYPYIHYTAADSFFARFPPMILCQESFDAKIDVQIFGEYIYNEVVISSIDKSKWVKIAVVSYYGDLLFSVKCLWRCGHEADRSL